MYNDNSYGDLCSQLLQMTFRFVQGHINFRTGCDDCGAKFTAQHA